MREGAELRALWFASVLIEATQSILLREDRDASEIVRAVIEREAVQLLCCGKDFKLAKDPTRVRMQVESHGKDCDVLVDQLLVAVGCAPKVQGPGLEIVGATIHPYPAQAEAIRKSGDPFHRTRLTPFVKKRMHRWLAWQR